MGQCTAKSKRSGQRCGRPACVGKTVCHIHGGKSKGAAKGNKHAVTTGAYEKIFPGCLTPAEQVHMAGMNTVPLAVIEEEIRLTRIRETRILQRIARAREAEEKAGTPTGEKTDKGQDILHTPMVPVSASVTTGGHSAKTFNSEAHSVYILKLENALTAVQGQLAKLADQKARLLIEAAVEEEQGAIVGYQGIPWENIAPSFLPLVRDVRMSGHTHYYLKGGRGSTKSSTAAQLLVDGIIREPETHALITRNVFDTVSFSVYPQLQWAIEELGQTHNFQFKKSPLEIIYKPTGQRIMFRGLDDPQKLKSIKPKSGYIRWIWYEEASEIKGGMEFIRNVNQSLMRGGDKFSVFYSYNPPKSKNNWINAAVDALAGRKDVYVHSSDYRTVPPEWLGEQFLLEAEALKEANPRAYEHEYLGIATGSGGDVFENVVVERIPDDVIEGLQVVRRGIDFGFSADPFVFVQNGYNRPYDTLYIFDEIYRIKLHDDEAAEAVRGRGVTREYIYCDCADPKGISNLHREGLNTVACAKFPGSREHGFRYLQRWRKIVIDPVRCPNAVREFTQCEYEQDKNGNFLSSIAKENDHVIDGVRYSHDQEIRNLHQTASSPVSVRTYAS